MVAENHLHGNLQSSSKSRSIPGLGTRNAWDAQHPNTRAIQLVTVAPLMAFSGAVSDPG